MKLRTTSGPKLLMLLLALALAVAACGSDSDETSSDSEEDGNETTTTEEATTTTEAEAETTATEAETTVTEAETTVTEAPEEEEEAAPADGVAIELGEWFVSEPGELTAGSITFALSNTGENPHAFAIAKGTSYEELPQLENGAVDTDALGDDFLGTTENIESGDTGSIDFDLESGDYVFFCPIQFGPNSHAAAGQVLSVSVG